MRRAEIEFWALGVISTVEAGNRVEDARVEMKADWPDPQRAARRLAGHANAARGDSVLWLIGVDERRGVTDVDPVELANWWPSTASHFEGPVPVVTPITVHHSKLAVMALFIETGAAPFLVRNPSFGSSSGGPVELEVPWREMTATRTARHEDLVRLLVPQLRLPLVEVLSAELRGGRHEAAGGIETGDFGPGFKWFASFTIYVVPQKDEIVVFSAHHVRVAISGDAQFGEIDLNYHRVRSLGAGRIADNKVDLIATEPSRLDFSATADYVDTVGPGEVVTATLNLRPAGGDKALLIRCELSQQREGLWTLTDDSVRISSLAI